MNLFYQQIINASMLGIIYSLIALGFTLYFGVAGVFNFAHGELVMVGAFAILTLNVIIAGLGFFSAHRFSHSINPHYIRYSFNWTVWDHYGAGHGTTLQAFL